MQLVAFFVLTFALMWACFFTVAFAVPATTAAGYALLLLGTFAPAISATLVTRVSDGDAGIRRLYCGLAGPMAALRWFVLAGTYTVILKLVGAVIHRLVLHRWPVFGTESLALIPFAIAFSTPVQFGEELGWRAFALPRLTERFGLAGASVLLGAIWGVWHLPQFFVAGGDTYGQSFPIFVLGTTGFSVAMAFVYWRARGNLWVPMLMHAAYNNSKDIVPSALQGASNSFSFDASPMAKISLSLMWIVAIVLLIKMRRVRSLNVPTRGII